MKFNLDKHIPYILTSYFVVVSLIVWPFGNFPLNDDWVHTLTIYTWLSEGRFWYPAWLAPTVHIPILYGIGITKIFGFSFVLLRMTTLIFAVGSCVCLYRLLRECGTSKNYSALGVILLAINPLFLHLSFTFMSDIPALFFLLASALLYKKGFEKNHTWYLFFGSIMAVVGFYTRQFVILIALAAGIAFCVKKIQEKKVSRKSIWQVFIAFGVPALACIGIYLVLRASHTVPGELHARLIPEQWSFITMAASQGWYVLLYIALFLSPLMVAIFVKNNSFFKERIGTFLFGITSVGILFALSQKLVFPKFGNIFSWFGIGPSADQVLSGTLPRWGDMFYYMIANGVAVLSLFTGIVAAGYIYVSRTHKKITLNSTSFIVLFCAMYFLLILSLRSFDRYILFLLPFGILFGIPLLKHFSWSKITFGILATFLGVYGIIGTHQYFRWNEARWVLAQNLLAQGVGAHEIDAGYEWVGWYLYGKEQNSSLKDFSTQWYIRELYPSHSRTYVLSFSPLKGYTILTQRNSMYLLKKNEF